MDSSEDRIAELIAGAVADELTPAESVELNELRRTHAWIDRELGDLRGVATRITQSGITWTDVVADSAARRRIHASASAMSATPLPEPSSTDDRSVASPPMVEALPGARTPVSASAARRPRGLLVPLLAAACLAIGVGIGATLPGMLSAPPAGSPGTLGAVEQLQVEEQPDGTTIEVDVVAHTWGTEAILDATGLDAGATYSVVLVTADGAEFVAGEMLGSRVPIHCRLNAAVLRADAVRLEVRQAGERLPTALAELPRI